MQHNFFAAMYIPVDLAALTRNIKYFTVTGILHKFIYRGLKGIINYTRDFCCLTNSFGD